MREHVVKDVVGTQNNNSAMVSSIHSIGVPLLKESEIGPDRRNNSNELI